MKRVMCPKCECYITFDETKYTEGQSLVFVCGECKKQFGIRIGKSKLKSTVKNEVEKEDNEYGEILVIENVFGYKQVLPLLEGENVIGRRCTGNDITTAIETSDMSMDRRHCVINIKRNKKGELGYTLRDFPSLTGTFLQNELLGDKDRIILQHGAIITIGATTFIFHAANEEA